MVSAAVKIYALIALTIILLPIFSPLVSAGRGGQMQTVEFEQYIGPDPRHNWTDTINMANATDVNAYNSYNATWVPFFENNTDIAGVLVTPPFTPIIAERDTPIGYYNWTTMHKFQLQAETVMDGASEAWFRLPMNNISTDAQITTRLWRLIVSDVNVSSITGSVVAFDEPDNVVLIYNITTDHSDPYLNLETTYGGVYDQLRWQNVTVNANYTLNMTYSKVCAPMYSGEWYYLGFTITDGSADNASLLLTNSDMFEDEYLGTLVHWDGSDDFYVADLDFSVVFTKGLSNGITGTPQIIDPGADYTHIMIRSIYEYSHTIVAGDYLSLIMPIVKANDSLVPFNVSMYVELWDSNRDWIYTGATSVIELQSTREFVVLDNEALLTCVGQTVSYINMTIYAAKQHTDDFRLYLQASNSEASTDILLRNWNLPGNDNWTRVYYGGFNVFSHMYINQSYWNQTNYSVIVIPIEEADTPESRYEDYQDWQIYIKDESGTTAFEYLLDTIYAVILEPIVRALWTLAGMAFDFWFWFMDNTVGRFLDSPWWGTIKGIGQFIWDIVRFLVDALEWFSYWGVRIIYAFSIALVYMVNVFAVVSINTGLLALTKSGNGKDLLRAFNAGWRFIFAIITLMLSLMVLAISIVAAVVPF